MKGYMSSFYLVVINLVITTQQGWQVQLRLLEEELTHKLLH